MSPAGGGGTGQTNPSGDPRTPTQEPEAPGRRAAGLGGASIRSDILANQAMSRWWEGGLGNDGFLGFPSGVMKVSGNKIRVMGHTHCRYSKCH